jgi:hypothetical protein
MAASRRKPPQADHQLLPNKHHPERTALYADWHPEITTRLGFLFHARPRHATKIDGRGRVMISVGTRISRPRRVGKK